MRALRRYAPPLAGFAIVLIVGLALGSVVVPPVVDTLFPLTPAPAGSIGGVDSGGASPTASPVEGLLMNGIPVSEKADCTACHRTEGGTMGVAITPALAHPLQGWTQCTQCHANNRLVPTAPGHQSFTQDQCLACHKQQGQGTAMSRPHHVYPGQQCTSCHNGKTAILPKDMSARNACWLCHHETPGASLFPEPSVGPDASSGTALPLPSLVPLASPSPNP